MVPQDSESSGQDTVLDIAYPEKEGMPHRNAQNPTDKEEAQDQWRKRDANEGVAIKIR